MTRQRRLKDRLEAKIRAQDKSPNTAKSYWRWIEQFIRYHHIRHPLEMGEDEVRDFLSSLAVDRNHAAATQDVAFNALSYLYEHVLERPLERVCNVVRSRKPKRLPEVFSVEEVTRVMRILTGWHALAAYLMYGGGLRVESCMTLRVKDLKVDTLQVVVRQPKGRNDYLTLLPRRAVPELKEHLDRVRLAHEQAIHDGYGGVEMPYALARKYPRGVTAWEWQYVFPSARPSRDPRTGIRRRHHIDNSSIQKAMGKAVESAGITRNCGCHTLRHSFATHLLAAGENIRTVQKLMGHKSVTTTEVYLHIVETNGLVIKSPADRLKLE